jgi:hypothetical protein
MSSPLPLISQKRTSGVGGGLGVGCQRVPYFKEGRKEVQREGGNEAYIDVDFEIHGYVYSEGRLKEREDGEKQESKRQGRERMHRKPLEEMQKVVKRRKEGSNEGKGHSPANGVVKKWRV